MDVCDFTVASRGRTLYPEAALGLGKVAPMCSQHP